MTAVRLLGSCWQYRTRSTPLAQLGNTLISLCSMGMVFCSCSVSYSHWVIDQLGECYPTVSNGTWLISGPWWDIRYRWLALPYLQSTCSSQLVSYLTQWKTRADAQSIWPSWVSRMYSKKELRSIAYSGIRSLGISSFPYWRHMGCISLPRCWLWSLGIWVSWLSSIWTELTDSHFVLAVSLTSSFLYQCPKVSFLSPQVHKLTKQRLRFF
jgi:uncharacterized membrane protein YhdT